MLYALDFETEAIENRPKYPPKPVGLAVMPEGGVGRYYAWGHPIENNSSATEAIDRVAALFADEHNEFVFHNAPFDLSVIEEWWDIPIPWARCHDTMLLAFLDNPHGELSLKPLAELHLGEPPEEQDAVREWLVKRGIVASNSKSWGAYIARAPGGLVGRYAIGDVRRTLDLYRFYESKLKTKELM